MRLQVEWGADEAIGANPVDRFSRSKPPIPVSAKAGPVVTSPGVVAHAPGAASAAADLEALRAGLAALTDCPLQATAAHLVFACAPATAPLLILGEAPGEEEDRTGRPFSGPGGKLLDKMLASIGLDRAAVMLSYVVPWRPPGNRPPTEHEVRLCLPSLIRQIALVRPARLVLLGGLPLRTLLATAPRTNLSRLRGRWQEVAIAGLETPLPALPMLHPDQLIANPAAKRQAWADLLTLRAALDEDARRHDAVSG